MESKKEELLSEIESEITKRKYLQNFYKILRVTLMVTIAVCGFLTATSSQVGGQLTAPTALLIFGLVSAVCAVLNQSLSPSASSLFHQNARKAMLYIHGEVKYGNMEVAEAHRLKSVAITNPDVVLGKLEDMFKEE